MTSTRSEMTVSGAIPYFSKSLRAQSTKQITIDSHVNRMRRFLKLHGERPLCTLNPFDIDEYVADINDDPALSAASKCAMKKSLKQFLGYCHTRGLTDIHLMGHIAVKGVKLNGRMKAISFEDLQALYRACHCARDRAIVTFIIDTGVRPQELCNLEIEHLMLDQLEAYIYGKTAAREAPDRVEYTRPTRELLRQWLDERPKTDHNFVFCGYFRQHTGKPLNTDSLRGIFNRLAHRASVTRNKSPKALRHYVGQLFTKEEDLETARIKLRHRSIETTQIYANVDRRRVKEATLMHSPVEAIVQQAITNALPSTA